MNGVARGIPLAGRTAGGAIASSPADAAPTGTHVPILWPRTVTSVRSVSRAKRFRNSELGRLADTLTSVRGGTPRYHKVRPLGISNGAV